MTLRGTWFYVVAALGSLLFMLFVRHRVRAVADQQEALRADLAPLRGFLLPAFSVFPLFMATLQYLGGFEDPFFYVHGDLSNPVVLVVWCMQVAFWVFLLSWVWTGSGVRTLAALWASSGRPLPDRLWVRLLVSVMVVGSVAAAVLVRAGLLGPTP